MKIRHEMSVGGMGLCEFTFGGEMRVKGPFLDEVVIFLCCTPVRVLLTENAARLHYWRTGAVLPFFLERKEGRGEVQYNQRGCNFRLVDSSVEHPRESSHPS